MTPKLTGTVPGRKPGRCPCRRPSTGRYADTQAAFAALALLDAGREREAALTALTALTGRLPVYGRMVHAYSDELAQTSDS